MSHTLVRVWAVIFVVLVACPFTPPFSTFDTSGPHGLQSDSHIGVASTKDLSDDQPSLAAVPVTMFWFEHPQSIEAIPAVDSVVAPEFSLVVLRI